MSNVEPIEVILLEYECRDFKDVAFVLRINNAPVGASRIQQIVWGVSPNFTVGNPPIFPVYSRTTEFNKEGNDAIRNIPLKGKLVDYASSFQDAVKKAYEQAKNKALFYTLPSKHFDSTKTKIFDRTRFTNEILPESNDPTHKLWYQTP